MDIDKTTINDLLIFDRADDFSVFNKLDCTVTLQGREQLKKFLQNPLPDIAAIEQVQQLLQELKENPSAFPHRISNGTLMVVDRLYEANIDLIPENPSTLAAASYRLLHKHDYALIRYSVVHVFDLVQGMRQFADYFSEKELPQLLAQDLEETRKILAHEKLRIAVSGKSAKELSPAETLRVAHFVLYRFKRNIRELMLIYARLDARRSMALAAEKFDLARPDFVVSDNPFFEATGLYNLLLESPVPYDLKLDEAHNFLFLTGANMAGKSTFIKAVGIAVFLAHTGMGVPAATLRLSAFHGLLSNINVIDNIAKGESYFFNEVQRIKATIEKITDGKKWLILIDELFKGTNVEDAIKCTLTVIEGLLKIRNASFILSTHLYEIGADLRKHPNIAFACFETGVSDDQLDFTYRLKEGISNDRLGYLILKREGVVALLRNLEERY